MSLKNDIKNAKRILESFGNKKLKKAADKVALLRKETSWTEEKVQKVLTLLEEAENV